MNLIFTTIWSEARQCMIVVSEFASVVGRSAKSSGKKINRALFGRSKLVAALSAGIANFSTSLLFAGGLPQGSSVTYGQGQVTQSANEMTITQSSAKMAIDWNSFNIGQGNKVTFVQPSSSSIAMNRVTGTDVSVIQGSLQANGQVFLSNPNGVLFTKDAQVNVGSLVATTLQMSNEDLAAGRYRLQGKSDKSVVNQGSITTTIGDGKGGVALIAAKIINEGSITADRGTVALAAANKVTLDLGGPVKVKIEEGALNALIEQGGAIRADGGTVIMSARAASNLMSSAINHTGVIEARSMVADANGVIQLSAGINGSIVIDGTLDVSSPSGKAGRIEVTAQDITLKKNSHLIASGDLGGGTVLIGGDWQGSGSLQQAQHVVMEQGASINASALTKGDGGKVVLWSDIHDQESVTTVMGDIWAEGGVLGGDGGKVETSGHKLIVHDVMVSTYAPKGKTGEWLLDPYDIVISNSGDQNIADDGNGNLTSGDTPSVINVDTLVSALARNHVTVSTGGASSAGGDAGDITVQDDITESGPNTLTLHAANNINVNANITRDGGGNVTLIADTGGVQGFGNITINGIGSMLTIDQGGDSTFNGFISGTGGLIKNGVGSLTLDTEGLFAQNPVNGMNGFAFFATSNTFTGNITVNQGSLIGVNQQLQSVSSSSSFGDPSISGRTITINNGGTLVFGANDIFGNDGFTPSVKLIVNNGGVVANRNIYTDQNGTFNVLGNIDLNGGTLSSTGGANDTFRSWYLKGNLTVGDGLISNISGGDNTAGLHISTNTFIDVGVGSRLIVSSAFRDNPFGSSSLSKTGSGDLTLSGNNFFTGTLNINAGSVTIGDGGNTGGITASSVVIGSSSSLRFNLNNAIDFSGDISGLGSVSQIGSGSTTLSNSNTYTGLTRITSGQIIATNANALGSTSSGTEIDGGGLVVTGSLVVAEPLSIKGSGVSGNGAVVSASGNNTLSGAISLTGNSTINSVSGSSLNITGALNGGSLLTANGSGNYTFGLIGNSAPVAGLNITTASNVSFLNSVTSSSNITVQASGNITINGSLAAANSTVKFNTTGVVTENGSGSITANSLALLGVGANYTLNSSANNVSIFAADTGTISYKNAGALTIGIVNPTGITATGPVSISTLSGDLTVSQNISTADTSSSALILNAGLSSAAGTVAGGDIVLSGAPTINVGAGGRATLFSGSVAGTVALATAVGNASLHFRYGSDEASNNFTTALGTGKYVIYRERPVINLTATNDSKTYDRNAYVFNASYNCSGCVNGDTAVNISYTGSAQGAINAGSYSITPVGDNLAALGYSIGATTSGSLTINKAPLTIKANNSAKVLTESDPIGFSGVSYTGFVNGETSSVLGGSLQLTRSAGEVAANYVLTPSGQTAANYNVSFVAGNFEIIGADRLVVTYQNASAAYGTTPNFNVASARYLSSTNNVIVQLGAPVVTGDQYTFTDITGQQAVYKLGVATPQLSTSNNLRVGNYDLIASNVSVTSANFSNNLVIVGARSVTQRSINVSGAIGLNKTYDGTNIVSGGRVDPTDAIWSADLALGNVNISGAPVYSDVNAGAKSIMQGSVTLSGLGAPNYNLIWANGSGTINKAPLTIKANNSAKVLTESDPIGFSGASYTGFVNGETSNVLGGSLQLTRSAGEVAANYVLTPSGQTAANYNVSFVAGNFEIIGADRLVVTYQNASAAYGTTPNFNVASARYLSSTNNVIVQLGAPDVSGDQYTFTDVTGQQAVYKLGVNAPQLSTSNTLKVGNYDLIASNVSVTSSNFSNNLVIVGTRTVSPKVITNITGINPVKEYDGSLSATISTGTANFSEKITSDVLTVSSGVGLFTDKNVGTTKQVNVSGLVLGGADKDNYVLPNGLIATTGSINPAPVSAPALLALNKTFDGNTNANIDLSTLQLQGLLSGDTVTLSVAGAKFGDAMPGSNKLVTFSTALAGADAGNYEFTGPSSATATILGTNAADTTNNVGLFAGAIHSVNTIRTNVFDRFPDQPWGMRPDSRLSYVDVSENEAMSRSGFENQEFRNQLHTDQVSTSGSDNKDNVPIPDSWSKLSGIIPIRVVKGGIKQPEFEEDFQEVRRYGNGR